MRRTILCLLILALALTTACTLQKKPTLETSDPDATSLTVPDSSSSITNMESESAPSDTTADTTTGTSAEDSPVAGLWTDDPSGIPVTIDEQGLPVGDIYEGEWYGFRPDGTFFRLYYSSGVSISGILIQEGYYQNDQHTILLTECTESFIPDLWEGQPEYYRIPIEDRILQYRLASLQGQPVVYITSPVRDVEQLYFRVWD